MSENQERHNKSDTPATPERAPKQAMAGGGTETLAGSTEGGSAYGDDREDKQLEKQPVEGGFKQATTEETQPSSASPEVKTFASPDGQEGSAREASTETVTNTGEPRPVKNGEGVEGQPGDDVDAATG